LDTGYHDRDPRGGKGVKVGRMLSFLYSWTMIKLERVQEGEQHYGKKEGHNN